MPPFYTSKKRPDDGRTVSLFPLLLLGTFLLGMSIGGIRCNSFLVFEATALQEADDSPTVLTPPCQQMHHFVNTTNMERVKEKLRLHEQARANNDF